VNAFVEYSNGLFELLFRFIIIANVCVVPPTIEDVERQLTVNESTEVVLPCMATGIPMPKVTWTHEGRTTIVSGGRFEIEENGKLFISNAQVTVERLMYV
jgi:hypothetical protein